MNNFNEEEKNIVDNIVNLQKLINSSNKKNLTFNGIEFTIYVTEENEKNIKREIFFELIPELKFINIQNINKLLNQYKINIDIYVQKVFFDSEPQKRNKIKLESNMKRKEKKKSIETEEIKEEVIIKKDVEKEILEETEELLIKNDNKDYIEDVSKIKNSVETKNYKKEEVQENKKIQKEEILHEEFEESLTLKHNDITSVMNTTEKQCLLTELNEIFNPFVNKKTSIIIGVLFGLLCGSGFIYILHNVI